MGKNPISVVEHSGRSLEPMYINKVQRWHKFTKLCFICVTLARKPAFYAKESYALYAFLAKSPNKKNTAFLESLHIVVNKGKEN